MVCALQCDIARQYLELCRRFDPGKKAMQHHMFKFLFEWSVVDTDIRDAMLKHNMTVDDYLKCVDMVEERFAVRAAAFRVTLQDAIMPIMRHCVGD